MSTVVLDKKRRTLLTKLGFLTDYGFYLAGGTSLALQIKHRTSLDFDFCTPKEFYPSKLKDEFNERLKGVKEIHIAKDTLILEIEGVIVSFFAYPYKMLEPYVQLGEVKLASLKDIAAMKIVAIAQRGRRRDFIDMYFLINIFGLKEIINSAKQKYPKLNIYTVLQGLTYFKDADEDSEEKRLRLFEEVNWRKVKNDIIKNVNQVRPQL